MCFSVYIPYSPFCCICNPLFYPVWGMYNVFVYRMILYLSAVNKRTIQYIELALERRSCSILPYKVALVKVSIRVSFPYSTKRPFPLDRAARLDNPRTRSSFVRPLSPCIILSARRRGGDENFDWVCVHLADD